MTSSSKENARSTMSGSRSPAKMNNGDVFSSPGSEMMLSPPPEEELRFSTRRPTHETSSATRPLANSMRTNQQQSPVANQAAKRKRTITGSGASAVRNQSTIEHTPNPRVRKQVRQAAASTVQSRNAESLLHSQSGGSGGGHSSTMQPPMTPTRKGNTRGRSTELVSQSPHAANPEADYIPATHLAFSPRGVSVRRRSVTPIPPYEPPKERYTPPREVIVSPPAPERKPIRHTTKKKRVTVKTEKAPVQLWVKTEPPEIDLTSPAPPASPGDDPILLVGPPSIRVQRPSLPPDAARKISFVDLEMDLELPENRSRAKPDAAQQAKSTEAPARSPSIPPAFDFSKLNDDDSGMAANNIPDSSSKVDYGTLIDDGNYGTFDDGAYATLDDGAWTDSDNENGNGEETTVGEGDFTGKFLSFQAPVKLDPPADDGDRMEKWARPISPHPKKLSLVGPKEEDADVSLDKAAEKTTEQSANGAGSNDRTAAVGSDTQDEVQEIARPPFEGRRGRRLTLSEVEAIKFGTKASTGRPDSATAVNSQEGHVGKASLEQTDEAAEQRKSNSPRLVKPVPRRKHGRSATLDKAYILDNHSEHGLNLKDGLNSQQILHTVEGNGVLSKRPTPGHSSEESSQSTLNNSDVTGRELDDDHVTDEEHKEHLLRYGKDAIQDETMDQAASLLREAGRADGRASECESEIAAEDDQGETSDDDASDMSVVKIVSDDPMAAARAAAILKAHDYDMVARKLRRRRKTTGGGISKPYNTPKNAELWRRRTVAGLTAEDVLSANVSLPDLLQKAEEELRCSPTRSRSGSVACNSVGSPQKPRWNEFMYENADAPGIREWCKADWKLLDSCFTDERYDLAEQMDLEPRCLADVDDVPLESVVERFIELMGGAEIVRSHGPSWATDKLFSRVKALCKRQRAGHGAPPTPDVPARFSTPSRFSMSPTPSMVVPDFTPAISDRSWMYDSGSVSRKSLLPPSSGSFFKVPSLPARHSRLREDVTSEVVDTPEPSRALELFGFATPARNVQQRQQDDSDDESVTQEVDAMLTPITASRVRQSRPESAVKRSLNYISSWLKPDMYKSNKEEGKGSQLPGLPVPPEDLLSKPRGPVETPAPKAAEKPVPHKELVSLEHVPPPKPTRIPRPQKPQRLVDLTHVPTPQPKEEVKKSLSRRSSTSSVKDLIKEFEEKDKGKVQALPPRVAELRRQASVGSLKGNGKPTWKP